MSDGVSEMRLVVTALDYAEALHFYRDVLGLRELGTFDDDTGALHPGRRPGNARALGRRTPRRSTGWKSGAGLPAHPGRLPGWHPRTGRLVDAGATLLAAPVETPWRSLNARLEAPAGLQLTLFQELAPEFS